MIDALSKRKSKGRVAVSNALLDLRPAERTSLVDLIHRSLADSKRGLTRPLSVGSSTPLTIVCSVDGKSPHRSVSREHALANAVLVGDSERILVDAVFDDMGTVIDVIFETVRLNDVRDPAERARIDKFAQRLLGQRMSKMSQKVGRNDACPCGGGKKFKKCHGS